MAEISGTSGNDPLIGTALDDTIIGGGGDDTITAAAGGDLVYGDNAGKSPTVPGEFLADAPATPVNEFVSGSQSPPITTVLDNGQVLYTWINNATSDTVAMEPQMRLANPDGTWATPQVDLDQIWGVDGFDAFDMDNMNVDLLDDGNVMVSYVRNGVEDSTEEPVFSIIDPSALGTPAQYVVTNQEIQTNDTTTFESPPVTTVLDDGKVLFVWSKNGISDNATMELQGRVYDPTTNTFTSDEYLISDIAIDGTDTADVENLSVEQLADGNVVVSWVRSNAEVASGQTEPVYQILDSTGAPVGPTLEMQATDTTTFESPAQIVALDDGNWMGVWVNNGYSDDTNTMQLEGRIFDADGNPLTGDIDLTGAGFSVDGWNSYDIPSFTIDTLPGTDKVVVSYVNGSVNDGGFGVGNASDKSQFSILDVSDPANPTFVAQDVQIPLDPDHPYSGPALIEPLGDSGAFVAVYGDGNAAGSGAYGLNFRIFDENGNPLTDDVQLVNTSDTGAVSGLDNFDWDNIDVDYNAANDTFTVNWVGVNDGSSTGVFTSGPIAGASGGTGGGFIGGPDGADSIDGGDGDDTLSGEGGNDTIDGGLDNDEIYGGNGNDELVGGAGDDVLYGDSDYLDPANAGVDASPLEIRTNPVANEVPGQSIDYLNAATTADGTPVTARVTIVDKSNPGLNVDMNGPNGGLRLFGSGLAGETVTFRVDFFNQLTGEPIVLDINATFADIDSASNGLESVSIEKDFITTYATSGATSKIDVDDTGTALKATSDGSGLTDASDQDAWLSVGLDDSTGFEFTATARGGNTDYFLNGSVLGSGETVIVPQDGGEDTLIGGEGADTIFGEGGDDSINGGDGSDLIYGDSGGAGPAPDTDGPTPIDATPVAGADHTFVVWGINDATYVDAPGNDAPFSSGSLGESDIAGSTFTLGENTSPVTVGLNDNDSLFTDGDNDQQLVQGVTINGVFVPAGETLETEYSYSVTDSSGNLINIYSIEEGSSDVVGFISDQPLVLGETYTFVERTSTDPEVPFDNISSSYIDPNDQATPGADGESGFGGNDTIIGGEGADTMFGEGGDDTFIVSSASEGAGDVINGGNGPDQNTDLDILDLRGAGPVTINEAADANDAGATAGTVTFADGSTLTFEGIEQILTDPPNDPPVLDPIGPQTAPENSTDPVFIPVALDPNGDTLTFSLTGDDASLFAIDPATGEVSPLAPLDFENPTDANGDGVYDITVVATDPAGATDEAPASITVTDVAEPDGVVDGEETGEVMFSGYDDNNAPTAGGGDQITEGDDSIAGNGGDDTIAGGGGNDTIDGGADNDSIDGGDGNDSILGGIGADSVLGGSGSDVIAGGDGDDVLSAVGSGNLIQGDAGNDAVTGSNIGGDTLLGGEGNDTVAAGNGATGSLVEGEAGDDTVAAFGGGQNTLLGGDGNDVINGNGTGNLFDGGSGNDQIRDFGGEDATLLGGLGDDTLSSGEGDDLLIGGEGNDQIEIFSNTGQGNDTMTGGEGFDRFGVSAGDDVITDFNTGTGQVIDDGDQTNNDFINLAPYYDDLFEMRRDLEDDGLLNQSVATDDYTNNVALPGTIDLVGVAAEDLTFDNTNLLCFADGTRIMTPTGLRAVESLSAGDLVCTLDHGVQPIRWAGHHALTPDVLAAQERLRPIKFAAGSLGHGLPERDLLVSPQHRMLVASPIVQRMFGADEVLVPAKKLVGLPGVERCDTAEEVTYHHLLLDQHEVLFAEGVPAESLFTGPMALNTLEQQAQDEIFELFPDIWQEGYVPVMARTCPPNRAIKTLVARHAKNGKTLLDTFQADGKGQTNSGKVRDLA